MDFRLTGDQELLRRLSHVLYAGRYPVPKTAGGSPDPWTLEYPADVERICDFLEALVPPVSIPPFRPPAPPHSSSAPSALPIAR